MLCCLAACEEDGVLSAGMVGAPALPALVVSTHGVHLGDQNQGAGGAPLGSPCNGLHACHALGLSFILFSSQPGIFRGKGRLLGKSAPG